MVSSLLVFDAFTVSSLQIAQTVKIAKKVDLYSEALSVALAVSKLFRSEAAYGTYTVSIDNDTWTVDVTDAKSGFNPNTMSESQWIDLLRLCGVETGTKMSVLVDSWLDWKDADSSRRLNGAEKEYYEDKGIDFAPRNGPIKDVRELLYMRGMTPKLFSCLAPLLSIYGSNYINLSGAPIEQLKALGIDRSLLKEISDLRAKGDVDYKTWKLIVRDLPASLRNKVKLSAKSDILRIKVFLRKEIAYSFFVSTNDNKVLKSIF